MKVLITGICGFVGSELALRLREHRSAADLQICGLDNLARAGSWRNRERLKAADIDITHGDIRLSTDIESVGSVDMVIDAAANASILAGLEGGSGSRRLVDNNLVGTINLLEFCRQQQAGFILLSTSRVYSIPPLAGLPVMPVGDAFVPQGDLPTGVTPAGISERYSTAAPVSLYGATKLASETLALEYGECFNLPVWINRCGVMSGAGQFGRADQGIFSFWLHSWKERKPLKYIGFDGQGHQVRDCLHPKDLVSLLLQQLETTASDKPRTVNLSGGRESAMSLAGLSAWCTERWGPRDVPADGRPRPFDLPWVVLDYSLATQTWGWKPETTTAEILTEIADFADTQTDWIGFSA